MPACPNTVIDIGPGLLQVALQVITIVSVYFGVGRIQKVVEGQQASTAAQTAATKGVKPDGA